MQLGKLTAKPVALGLELVAKPVALALATLPLVDMFVAEIDPSFSDTATFCAHYEITLAQCANCVILKGKDRTATKLAACMVLGSMRLDVNGAVKSTLAVKKVSFALAGDAVEQSHMEPGAITSIGLPPTWEILVDEHVIATEWVVIGSGLRKSKLIVPGNFFMHLPHARVVSSMATLKST